MIIFLIYFSFNLFIMMYIKKLYRYEAFQVIIFKSLIYIKNRNIYIQFDTTVYCEKHTDVKL